VRTVLAALDMAAERGSATDLDCRHDLQLSEAHVTGIGISPRRPWARKTSATSRGGRATRPWSAGRRSLRQLDAQPLQRTLDVADRVDGDAGVKRSRLELRVAEQHLDHSNIDALLERWVAKLCRSVCGEPRKERLGRADNAGWPNGSKRADRRRSHATPKARTPPRAVLACVVPCPDFFAALCGC
jgi:hypothetical protein